MKKGGEIMGSRKKDLQRPDYLGGRKIQHGACRFTPRIEIQPGAHCLQYQLCKTDHSGIHF